MVSKRIAIIGAGAGGLCAAKHMLSSTQGVKLIPVVFEMKSCVGGTWVYEDVVNGEEVFSSIYKNLRANLPKQVMYFPGFPFPDEVPSFVHHTVVRKYLEDFAEHFKLHEHVRFNTKVIDVEPLASCNGIQDGGWIGSRWIVTSQDVGDGKTTKETFDGVVVSNGHFSVPCIPDLKGFREYYRKNWLHSHTYRDPDEYSGKTVLLLGAGSSGLDIGTELMNNCTKVYISHTHVKAGFTLPDNMIELPKISHVDEEGLFVLEDGSGVVEDVDVVMFCTGFLHNFPFLSKNSDIDLDESRRVVRGLYKHLVCIDNPSICFVGLPSSTNPFPVIHQQCGYIASIFSGVKTLPSKTEMNMHLQNDLKERSVLNEPAHYFHKLRARQFEYCDVLASMSGLPKNPPIIENIFKYVIHVRKSNHCSNYKDSEFKILNDTEFQHI